jgi:hypothetical protein
LIDDPLTIHRDERSIILRNGAEFAREAAHIFTEAVRKDLLRQEGFFCRDTGLSYGAGTVWVRVKPAGDGRPERYVISIVNVGEVDPTQRPSPSAPEVKLRCSTPTHTVLVEEIGPGRTRYRSWGRGKPLSADADLVLEGGTATSDGSGVCRHATYAFHNASTIYEVSELGCTDGAEPAGATGRLRILRADHELRTSWCRAH